MRGLNRLHQFDKVEIVAGAHPDESYATLDTMVAHVKGLLEGLELPYRILRLCGGDMGFTSALTYDFEVWSAAQERWLEVSSVSNFETFQANRLKCRFKDEDGKNKFVHTLNGSALALPRIVAALLENHQDHDGVAMPKALVPFVGFERIDTMTKQVLFLFGDRSLLQLQPARRHPPRRPSPCMERDVNAGMSILSAWNVDSVAAARERVAMRFQDLDWLVADSTLVYTVEDGQLIGNWARVKRFLKDGPTRLTTLDKQGKLCLSQLDNLMQAIRGGATEDANGTPMDEAYFDKEAARELKAAEQMACRGRNRAVDFLGIELEAATRASIDSLLQASSAPNGRPPCPTRTGS